MSRLSRKNRTDIDIKTRGGIFDSIDNAMKSMWCINDDEYDYICEHATDDELNLVIFDGLSLSEKKKAIKIVDDLLNKMYN